MRLELVLSQAPTGRVATKASVKQAARQIEAGHVTVCGVVVLEPSYQVLVGGEEIALGGALVDTSRIFHSLLLFHKPSGAVCEAQSSARSIFRLLPATQQHSRLVFFGRLDLDTTGLMLLGTDGGLGD